MLIPAWFAIFYPIAIFLLFVSILVVGKSFPKKPFFRKTVSSLGERITRGHRFFNHTLSLLGILNIPMVYALYLILPKNIFTFIGLLSLLIGCIATFFDGVFPKGHKLHDLFAYSSFGGYILSCFFLVYPLIKGGMLPRLALVLDFLFIFAVIFVILSNRYRGDMWYNKKKPLTKNMPFWQWVIFLLTCCWMILLFLALVFS